MYDRSRFLEATRRVHASGRGLCVGFQQDLSCLLDSQLSEEFSRRALAHLEGCPSCAEFFQAIRLQALAHKDMAIPGSLAQRLRRLRGQDLFEGMADAEILRRLATALYQLGKSYVLLGTDGDYLLAVAEEPVHIDSYESGEMTEAARAAEVSGAGRLSAAVLRDRSEGHLATGKKFLEEALRLKPRFAEARLYLGFVSQVGGDANAAAGHYREVFLRTDRHVNRAHAAIQLGMLYDAAKDHRKALRMYRWVVASGLVNHRPEFAFVFYNIAVEHISLGDLGSGAAMLRRLHRDHPEIWEKSVDWLRRSPEILARLRGDTLSRQILEEAEPAFFAA